MTYKLLLSMFSALYGAYFRNETYRLNTSAYIVVKVKHVTDQKTTFM